MSELKVITDRKWKNFKYFNELPVKRQRELLKEAPPENAPDNPPYDNYIIYRVKNHLEHYHLNDFQRIDSFTTNFKDWDGVHPDSFFSGVLIKISEDGEQYKIGRYYS